MRGHAWRPTNWLAATIIALSPAQAGSIQDQIGAARAAAGQCAFSRAIAVERAALDQAGREWPVGHEGFFLLHQDLATWSNERFDYAAAEASARSAAEIAREKRGEASPLYALAAQNLGVALVGQQRFGKAEPLLTGAAASFERQGDPESQANALNAYLALSGLEFARGRSAAGLAMAEKAVALMANLPADQTALRVKASLRIAEARRRMLKLAEASAAIAEAERGIAKLGGEGRKRLLLGKASIAFERNDLNGALKRLSEAERLPADPCDPLAEVDIAYQRGSVHMIRRELPEAAASFTQSLAALTATDLRANPREPEIIYGLAVVAGMSRDFRKAADLFDRAAGAFRRIYDGPSEAEAQTYMEKGRTLGEAGQGAEAVRATRSAMALLAGGIDGSPLTDTYGHASLGLALFRNREFAEADHELRIALVAFEKVRGAASFDLAPGLNALGEIALDTDRPKDAASLFVRAVGVQRRWGGDSAIGLGISLSRLAAARDALGMRREALDSSAEAVAVLRKRLAIGEARPWNDAEVERIAARSILTLDLQLTAASIPDGRISTDPATVSRMLEVGQFASATRTGAAIAQMTGRLGQADSRIGALLRERNDLSAEWRAIQDEVIGLLATDTVRLDDERRLALLRRQGEVTVRVAEIDRLLAAQDPNLDLLIKSKVVGLATMQAALRPNEAALMLTVADDAGYAVVVRPDRAAAYRSALSAEEVGQLVGRLRSGLDPSRWRTQLPPIDTEAAYRLFAELVSPAMPVMEGADTLLIVPDGPLSSLPFAALLTKQSPPIMGEPEDYTALPWLIRRFAIATYPSAASIVALRSVQSRGDRRVSFLGVGAPLFEGPPGKARRGGDVLRGMARGTLADVTMLRQLPPLPETRDELAAMAKVMGAGRSRLMLGAEANEATVRSTPLDGFGVLVFATHGLIAGDVEGYAEPALALTPPAVATAANDGLLNASEVALLKLRADWVILSACNTAAGDGSARAEPLSGLAKAFFYAGARSLLVTHWPVDSAAAAQLSADTVRRATAGSTPAMALREAAIAFIEDRDHSLRTHPFFWAPFSLIGGQ